MIHNLKQCQTLIQKAFAAGAKALILPEASDYIASSPSETVALAKPIEESEFVIGVREEARKFRLPVIVGIHEPVTGGGRVRNSCIWIDEGGEIKGRYQKVHLFDVEIEGGPVLRESSVVEKGLSILPPFETPIGRVGMAICFDVKRSPQFLQADFLIAS
ncbi:MAG: Carbon-nitrogen hydrolase [Geoglossum simile]|nr:MAG: Carbon-nitrogen hydrolase [Geoglossum simile]